MGDRNEPTWVDYGNLAANMIQVGQLSNVQARLKDLAQIEAAREERGRLENQLRQFIFDLEGSTANLPKYLQNAPRGVVVATGLITEVLNVTGVQPSTFQEFVDKDRIRSYRQYLSNLKQEGMALLGADEATEIEELLPLAVQAGALEQLITALEAKEELGMTETEWNRLEEAKNRQAGTWTAVIYISLAAAPLFLCWGASVSSEADAASLFCLLEIFALVGLGIGLANRAKAFTPEYRAMEARRKALQAKLLPIEKFEEFCKIFGEGLSLEEYRQKNQAINAFLEKSLRQDKYGNPLPEPILWELPPPSGT